MNFERGHLSSIGDAAEANAREFFAEAQQFASEEKWARAYSTLVFALEETAKATICNMYHTTLNMQNDSAPGITKKHVEEMFSKHQSKRITMLAQIILTELNTFDRIHKIKVNKAIKNGELHSCPEVYAILQVYVKIKSLRELGLYVDDKGRSPQKGSGITAHEYNKLEEIVRKMLSKTHDFTMYKYQSYDELLRQVKVLLEQMEKQ